MSNLAYLGVVVVLSLGGGLVLWMRNHRPRSMEHSVREFSKELEALAPPDAPVDSRRPMTYPRLPRSRPPG